MENVFFILRSPKLDQKMAASSSSGSDSSATNNNNDIYKRHLRKTNSWHPAPQIQVKFKTLWVKKNWIRAEGLIFKEVLRIWRSFFFFKQFGFRFLISRWNLSKLHHFPSCSSYFSYYLQIQNRFRSAIFPDGNVSQDWQSHSNPNESRSATLVDINLEIVLILLFLILGEPWSLLPFLASRQHRKLFSKTTTTFIT